MRKTLSFVVVFVLIAGVTVAAAALQRGRTLTPEQQAERARQQAEALAEEMATPRPIEALDSVWIEELTWMEVRDAVAGGKTTAIVATGGIEQNGPYLATGKHNYVLNGACEGIARKLGNALCAPVIKLVPEGNHDPPSGHMRYPGTISLREETFRAVLSDVAMSLKTSGFENVVFIGDSGGNQSGMEAVAAELNEHWTDARAHFVPEFYRYADVFTFMEEELGIVQGESDGYHDDYVDHDGRRPGIGSPPAAGRRRQGVDQRPQHRGPRADRRGRQEAAAISRRRDREGDQRGDLPLARISQRVASRASVRACEDKARADSGAEAYLSVRRAPESSDQGSQTRRHRVGQLDPWETGGKQLGDAEGHKQADHDANGNQAHTLADDHADNVRTPRPQGHPQPDLVGALADQEADDAVDTDDGEGQRDHPDDREQNRNDALVSPDQATRSVIRRGSRTGRFGSIWRTSCRTHDRDYRAGVRSAPSRSS